MSELTHWKQLTDARYIGAYSLQEGEERIVEILSVSKQKVKSTDGKENECIVATLKNEKPFIINKTNCKTLTKVFGSPFIENWKNQRIIIYADNVKAFGEYVDALRVKPVKHIMPTLSPESPKWRGAIAALIANTVTIEQIEKNYTLSAENRELLLSKSI